MYNRSGVQCYRETDIQTMRTEKMIVLLYERIVADLSGARKALLAGNRVDMTSKVSHSQRIVLELQAALDHSIGGEIAANLESLYGFLFQEHLAVLVDQDVKHLDDCLAVLDPLLEAWRKIPSGSGERAAQEQSQNDPTAGPDPSSPTPETTRLAPQPADPPVEVPNQVSTSLSVSA